MKILSAMYSILKALLNNIARFLLSGISAKSGDAGYRVKCDFRYQPGYLCAADSAHDALAAFHAICDRFYTLILKATGRFSTLSLALNRDSAAVFNFVSDEAFSKNDTAVKFFNSVSAETRKRINEKYGVSLQNIFSRKLFKQNETDQNQNSSLNKNFSAENNFAENISAQKFYGKLNNMKNIFNIELFKQNETDQNQKNILRKSIFAGKINFRNRFSNLKFIEIAA